MVRLSWSGSRQAQSEANAAFDKLRPKKAKSKKRRKNKRQGRACNHPPQAKAKRPRYDEYIQSPAWKRRRQRAIELAGGQCQRCGSALNLRVHHKTYKRLGSELDQDLEVLCVDCHDGHHLAQVLGVSAEAIDQFACERF